MTILVRILFTVTPAIIFLCKGTSDGAVAAILWTIGAILFIFILKRLEQHHDQKRIIFCRSEVYKQYRRKCECEKQEEILRRKEINEDRKNSRVR